MFHYQVENILSLKYKDVNGSKNRSVFFVGSFPNPITGQSVALQKAWEGYPYTKYKLDNGIKNSSCRLSLLNPFWIVWRYVTMVLLTIGILIFKKPDVVYISISRTLLGSLKDLPAIVFSKFLRIPIVCHLHGADFNSFINSTPTIVKPFYNFFYNRVSMYIVLTVGMKNEVKRVLRDNIKVHVISNFYDSIIDETQADDLLNSKSANVEITYVSNLLYSKGVIHLIDGFIKIQNQFHNQLKLNIAGKLMSDNFMSEREISSIFREKIAGRSDITYLGILTGCDKYELLRKSNIFILPTFYPTEAQPLAILEALRMGCYIITTNHNYLSETVNSSNGEIIEPNSIEAIEKSIKNYLCLTQDIIDDFTLKNMYYAMDNFSLEKYQGKLNALLNTL